MARVTLKITHTCCSKQTLSIPRVPLRVCVYMCSTVK